MTYHIVATEGATADGRTISATHLEQMAKNYNPSTYSARIWLEHIRGLLPDSAFNALGEVLALKTQKNQDGKIQLLASIKATPELIKINQQQQKLYTSVEIDPNFAQTGEAYLVGLAVTDSPASLGTSRLVFSAQAQQPAHLFSVYQEQREEVPSVASKVLTPSEGGDDGMALRAEVQALRAMVQQLQAQLSHDRTQPSPDYRARPLALGAASVTDC